MTVFGRYEAQLASRPPPARPPAPSVDRRGYLAGVLTTALATALAFLILGREYLTDVVMTYLLGIVIISMRFDFRVSVATAVLSVLAFDFFFIPPYLTFTVADLRHIITFVVMLLVAVVIAGLTQRVKDQVQVARKSERRTRVLYAMSRELTEAQTAASVIEIACDHIEGVFGARAAVFGRDVEQNVTVAYLSDGAEPPDEEELGIVRWVWNNRREAGGGTQNLPDGSGYYLPLAASSPERDVVGVLGIFPKDASRFRDPEQRRLAEALARQMALAMERAQLSQETRRARLQVEAEQLRSTLLSSVSHDLRTPIAVMKGAASTLVDDDASLPASTRRDLAETLLEETDRLERLIRNLLDMTRLESGAVRIQKEWQSVEETVGGALSRLESRLRGRTVTTRVPAELLAPFDSVLIEQVLINLLENAAKHTREGVPIEVSAMRSAGEVLFEVADRGSGLPPGEETRVFEKFHRGRSQPPATGVGLGLTICDAVVRAHGGRIWAENREGGGASFGFALPLEGAPPVGRLPEIEDKSA